MKRLLLFLLCLISITSTVMADEKEDLMEYYLLQANYTYLSGDFSEARENYEKAFQLYRDIHKNISRDTVYAQYMAAIGRLCYLLEDYQAAISAATEAAKIFKTVHGTNHLLYIQQLNDLSTFNADSGNYKQAIIYASEATALIKSELGPKDQYYAFSLACLAFYYSKLELFEDAALYYTKNKEATEDIFGKESVYYLASLSNLADTYSNLKDFPHAIQYTAEALEIKKTLSNGVKDYEYALLLDKLAKYYSLNNDFDHALQYGTEALSIIKQTDSIESKDHAAIANNVANYHAHLGHYNEAIQLGYVSINIFEKHNETYNLDYALALNNLAAYYAHIGDYNQGLKLGLNAFNLRKSLSDNESIEYAMTLGNMANCYAHLDQYYEAIKYGSDALKICKMKSPTDTSLYTTLLSNLANYYAYSGKYKEAIQAGYEVLNIKKIRFGSQHPDYAISLSNLSTYHFYNNEYNKAIQLGSDAMKINKKTLSTSHPQLIASLSNLSYYYAYNGNYNKAIPLIRELLPIIRNNIVHTFSGLTAYERMQYWDLHSRKLRDVIPYILIHSTDPDAASLLYDYSALFAKSLLLSTELEMTKLIQESGDVVAPQVHMQLRQIRRMLNDQYAKPFVERIIDCDSLERASSELERQLASRVKEIGDYTRNLNISWRDVQNKLGSNDIAIEFLSYPEQGNTYAYVALTLCKNDTAPILIPLFSELQLKETAGRDETYHNLFADALVWGPLSSRLEGKSHVYFSASGMLHNIGIEYLPSMDGKECHRLSSTRDLAISRTETASSGAVVYGGIIYDTDVSKMGIPKPIVTDYAARSISPDSMTGRGNWDYLPGSLDEANEVDSILARKSVAVKKVIGSAATETSFKDLSGQRKRMLHIATHGFYYNDSTAHRFNDRERLGFLQMDNDRPRYVEDKAMTRSGLLFAGAQNTFDGVKIPEGVDDGVLTAQEVSQLDLRGLNLLVLSACQTGLGEISGEGVFGLQRGFKKAGAQSILMSLWKVNDEATHLLMTEFYRSWTSGLSKYAALRQAQSVVKEKYPDPKYWAAFILLDALD